MYQPLAALLGNDQPVYGIQSRYLAGAGPEFTALDELASEYARVIRSQQPDGPYHLFGWSIGGVFAVATAAALERQGQRVAFVALLDSFVEDDELNDDADPLPALGLALGGRAITAFLRLDAAMQDALRAELRALPAEERAHRGVIRAQELQILPPDIDPQTIQRQADLVWAHHLLRRQFADLTLHVPLHVWWARGTQTDDRARTDWSRYTAEGVVAEDVEGDHFSVMQPPALGIIAGRLKQYLRDVRGGSAAPTAKASKEIEEYDD